MATMQPSLAAGDTLKFSVTLAAYPATAGWTLHYRLTPRSGGSARTFDATASGDDHQVNVPAATSATWVAGDYTCGAWVTNVAGERYTIASESGQVVVQADPASLAAGVDTRSTAELSLAAVQAKLGGKATDGIERYRINGREVQNYTITELIRLEQHLRQQVASEKKAAGFMGSVGTARRIFVRTA